MSVWTDPHYRSEPLIIASQYLDIDLEFHPNVLSLCNFSIDPFGHFAAPAPAGNFMVSLKEGKARLTSVAYKYGRRYNQPFSDRFIKLAKPSGGIEAVYRLFSHIFNGKLTFKQEFDEPEFKGFTEKFLKAYGPAGYSSPSSWAKFAETAVAGWNTTEHTSPLFWFQQAEAVRHLNVAGGIKSYKASCHKAKNDFKPLPWIDKKLIFGKKNYHWRAYRHESVTILEYAIGDKEDSRRESFVLLGKDINRFAQMLESTGKIFHYFSLYADNKNPLSLRLIDSVQEIMNMLVSSFLKTTPNEKNSICRAMDIGQYIYLAEKAGPLSARSLREQQTKGHNGIYDKVFPLDDFTNVLRRYQIREALELASIRKMLPVPDFCIYSATYNTFTKHNSPFAMLPHPDPETTYEDFLLYWDYSMIRNYYDRHNKCPGHIKPDVKSKNWHHNYPHIVPKSIPYKDVKDINWEGTFQYSDYHYAEHELRKDKTMAPKRVAEDLTAADLATFPIHERNQIAALFLDPTMPRLADLRTMIETNSENFDYVHLTALKPESKKEGGRMFFMANDPVRTPMSEKEANVSDYLIHKAGNSSGIPDLELLRRMREISTLPLGLVRKVLVSFDLEGWSPKQNPQLKKSAYDKWSYAFGLPHIKSLHKVFDNSRIAFIKHNVHHEYINHGQDLEGYDAKTNTALHIEVMSYAINVCRRLKKIDKGATLLALIDDGGMSLEFDIQATDEEIMDCINCIEQVYHMVGLRISWDKTFVSEKLFQYLNEVYYNGFKVTPGLKAFLRVGKDVDVPAKTIADDLDAISGQIQGGLKAGASFMMSYCAYAFEVYRTLKRWSRYKVPIEDRHILMCLTPVAFGGLGVKSMLQLATNEAFNPVTAGIGNLKAFCTYYPDNAPLVNALLNSTMREMKEETFLRAPKAIRAETRTLNLQRFANVMREWLVKEARNPYVKSVLQLAFDDSNIIFSERIANQHEISAMGLQAIANLRPEAAVDMLVNKLQRSQTAASLLGFTGTLRILLANRYQALHCIQQFGKEVKVQRLVFMK